MYTCTERILDMGVIALVFALFAGLTYGQTIPKSFTLTQDATGFEVSIGETKILDHDVQSPLLYLGRGYTKVLEHYGNFNFDEYTESRIPLVEFSIQENDETTVIRLSASSSQQTSVELTLSTTQEHQLDVSFSEYPEGFNRTWLRTAALPGEHVYGAGEQFSYFDLRGRSYPIWTREQGVGRNYSHPLKYLADVYEGNAGGDYHTTYFPQASFVSSRQYYCHILGTGYMILDFEADDFHELIMHETPTKVVFQTESTMLEVTQSLSSYFGRQPPLPEWLSTGTVIGMQGGTDKMLDVLAKSQENGLSVSGLWIQDWSGNIYTNFGKRVYWNWEWNPEHYPNLDTEIIRLRDEEGVRLLAYITGHFIVNGTIFNNGTGRGYFMQNADGEEYIIDFGQFQCGTVDLTNPEAREWYKGIMRRNLIDFGFGGWMADFGEYIPYDAVFSNGETGRTMHNKFSVLWAQLNREVVEEAGKLGEIMFFMRAGGPGTQQYSVNTWAGDQNVDWSYSDGLASTVPAALSLGMSGFGLTHFDIGGYTTMALSVDLGNLFINLTMVRTEELFFRGAEYAAFTTMMRTHEGNRPDLNFQVYAQNDTIQQYSTFVDMFKALSEYTKHVMEENHQLGLPVQRPLFLHYENDLETFKLEHQYLLGRDLLVAPVLQPSKVTWLVYLPVDDWRYLYDDTPYTGGDWVLVPAPLGKPPVFYRAGSTWVDTFKSVAEIANNAKAFPKCTVGDDSDGCN